MDRLLKKINVDGLFDMFNHEIMVRHDEKITIVTAPNGFGKTAVLKLTNAFFSGAYWEFFKIGFRTFRLEFSDASAVEISNGRAGDSSALELFPKDQRNEVSEDDAIPNIGLKLYMPGQDDKIWQLVVSPPVSLNSIERHIPYLERVGVRSWVDMRTGRNLGVEEVTVLYAQEVGEEGPRKREPEWLRTFRASLNCRFIETQRLLRVAYSPNPRRHMRDAESHLKPVVGELASELAGAITSKLTEYAALSQSRDSTFPQRLIADAGQTRLSEKEARERLAALAVERSKLMEAGLLDKDEALQLSSDKISSALLGVLATYIDDTTEKLSIFDDIYARIETLRNIINERFQYKTLYVNKTCGFGVRLHDGSDLPLQGLSSGEQHELVLFYELLFDVKPNSLILIDEPELSLHVAWQKEFIKDLQSIIKLRGFYAIVATHSPQIINDRWDLTIGLEGPD